MAQEVSREDVGVAVGRRLDLKGTMAGIEKEDVHNVTSGYTREREVEEHGHTFDLVDECFAGSRVPQVERVRGDTSARHVGLVAQRGTDC